MGRKSVNSVMFENIDKNIVKIEKHLEKINGDLKENSEAIIKMNERVSLHSKVIKGTIGFFSLTLGGIIVKLIGKS